MATAYSDSFGLVIRRVHSSCLEHAGVTYFLGDWTAQTFEGRPLLGINTLRLLRSVINGGETAVIHLDTTLIPLA